jgi:hypothetical protein
VANLKFSENPNKHSGSTRRSLLRPVDSLFIIGCLLVLGSVFLVWRTTSVVNSQGPLTLTITAWDTGLLGGQGLFVLSIVVLLLFIPANALLGRIHPFIARIVSIAIIAVALISTINQVMNFYSNRTDLAIKMTYLGPGFYVSMLTGNLFILYLFLLLRRGSQRKKNFRR